MPIEREELIVAGRRLDVARIPGPAERKPIVLLHEGLGSIELWRNFPEQLAASTNRAVVAYSRYGHGQSEQLQAKRAIDYMHDEATFVLPDLLQQLGIGAPILFGHSDGASIALIYAANFPDALTAVVLEAPHVFVEPLTIRSIEQARRVAASGNLLEKLGRYHADAGATFRGWNDIWLQPEFVNWNITGLLPDIRAPILVLQGHDDEYGTPAQLNAIEDAVPNVTTILLDKCGHSPHRDQSAAVLERTRVFLSTTA